MANNQVSEGKIIPVTLATGTTSTAGNIWMGTNMAGVYLDTGTAGETVAVAVSGVYEVAKTASAGDALTIGDQVFAVTTGGANEAQAAGTVALGHAWEAAATGATTAKVRLGTF
jgi:predicted RecA/RadA family phage recombinase